MAGRGFGKTDRANGRRGLASGLALALALTACTVTGAPNKPHATPHGVISQTAGVVSDHGAGIIGDAGASIIGDAGASLIANNGGSLIGKVKMPAGVVSNNSGTLVSDQGGSLVTVKGGGIIGDAGASIIGDAGASLIGKTKYTLAAAGDPVVGGVTVTLVDAGGTPFKDAAGHLFQAKTDATGSYHFDHTPRGANLVARVDLPASVGPMLALVPDAAAGAARQVDVDGTSTLVMGYVLDAYVRPQPHPRDVLGRLPAAVEADTRAKAAAAVGTDWPAPRFTTTAVRAAVGTLRARNAAFDGQMDYVKSLLVAGLKDLGDGQAATKVALTYPVGVARLPDGSLLIAERNADRIRRRWPDGHLTTFAGKAGGRTLGDGGPATEAYIDRPSDLAVNAQGDVFVADLGHHLIRRIDGKTGIITTVAGNGADPTNTTGHLPENGKKALEATLNHPLTLALDSQGRCVFWSNDGTYRIEADGTLKGIETDDHDDPETLVTGPDGNVYGYQHASGMVSELVGDALAHVKGVAPHPHADQAHLAVAPDGQFYVASESGIAHWDGKAWQDVAIDVKRPHFKNLRVDADNVVVCDAENNRVWQVPRAGGATTLVAGLAPASGDQPVPAEALGLNRPTAIAIDPQGNLYVADGLNSAVWKRLPNGLYTRFAGNPDLAPGTNTPDGGPANQTLIGSPLALTVLPNGHVLMIDGSRETLIHMRDIAPDGTMHIKTLPAGVILPAGLAQDAKGTLYVSDPLLRQVYRLGNDSADALAPDGGLQQPGGLVVAPDGSIYVTDAAVHAVYHLADGKATVVAGGNGEGLGGDGGPATAAKLDYPLGIVMDAAGRLYVADSRNDRVRRIDLATGLITTVVGPGGLALNGTAPDDSLKEPIGLTFDAEENLYIADSGHNQVKLVKRSALGP